MLPEGPFLHCFLKFTRLHFCENMCLFHECVPDIVNEILWLLDNVIFTISLFWDVLLRSFIVVMSLRSSGVAPFIIPFIIKVTCYPRLSKSFIGLGESLWSKIRSWTGCCYHIIDIRFTWIHLICIVKMSYPINKVFILVMFFEDILLSWYESYWLKRYFHHIIYIFEECDILNVVSSWYY